MKKILIVNNNLKVGGVQKSLYNLLWNLPEDYEISLYLFQNRGEYAQKLPPQVKILEDRSLFAYLGRSQGECRGLKQRLTRGILAALTKLFGRHWVMRLLLWSKKTLPEEYDCAIAFLHNGNPKNFYGGVQDFVLRRTRAKKKIAFLHCDYATCGANHKHNNRLLEEFDAIAACSRGCREAFCSVLPELAERCSVVHNCHRYEEIRALAAENPVVYEPDCFHILMVCRLAHEKGVDRAIHALAAVRKQGMNAKLHLVGDGAKRQELQALCRDLQLTDAVIFHGEQANPYRYMPGADLFLLSSYHEAAPLVIEEAACLGLPILTVRTTSASEMVTDKGWVCDNEEEALQESLLSLMSRGNLRDTIRPSTSDNQTALAEFHRLTDF